jgi:tetratricopeptide (TPR) repeat protein
MVRIARALAVMALGAAVHVSGAPQAPTPAPTPAPNPLAEPFKAGAEAVDRTIAQTPEWLRVYAGAVVSDWSTVRADALKLTVLYPQDADVRIALAVGLEGTGDHEGAVAALRKAVELSPKHLGGWLMLAQMNYRLDRLQESALALEQARGLAPQNIGLLMQLAQAYVRLGDAERASRVLAGATKAEPDNIEAWVNYLITSVRTKQAETAWREFNQLRSQRPGVAGEVAKHLPAEVADAMPTPIAPHP